MSKTDLAKRGVEVARSTARKFSQRVRINEDELFSFLLEKVCLLINRYDPTRHVKFESYASSSLSKYCFNFLRDHNSIIRVPRVHSEHYLKLSALRRSNGHSLSDEKMAQMIGTTPERLELGKTATHVSYEEISDSSEYQHSIDSSQYAPDTDEQLWEYIREEMNPISKLVLEKFYIQKKAITEISSELDISVITVEQVIEKEIEVLKSIMD